MIAREADNKNFAIALEQTIYSLILLIDNERDPEIGRVDETYS